MYFQSGFFLNVQTFFYIYLAEIMLRGDLSCEEEAAGAQTSLQMGLPLGPGYVTELFMVRMSPKAVSSVVYGG